MEPMGAVFWVIAYFLLLDQASCITLNDEERAQFKSIQSFLTESQARALNPDTGKYSTTHNQETEDHVDIQVAGENGITIGCYGTLTQQITYYTDKSGKHNNIADLDTPIDMQQDDGKSIQIAIHDVLPRCRPRLFPLTLEPRESIVDYIRVPAPGGNSVTGNGNAPHGGSKVSITATGDEGKPDRPFAHTPLGTRKFTSTSAQEDDHETSAPPEVIHITETRKITTFSELPDHHPIGFIPNPPPHRAVVTVIPPSTGDETGPPLTGTIVIPSTPPLVPDHLDRPWHSFKPPPPMYLPPPFAATETRLDQWTVPIEAPIVHPPVTFPSNPPVFPVHGEVTIGHPGQHLVTSQPPPCANEAHVGFPVPPPLLAIPIINESHLGSTSTSISWTSPANNGPHIGSTTTKETVINIPSPPSHLLHSSPPSIPTHPSPPAIPTHSLRPSPPSPIPSHPLHPSIPTHPPPPAIPTHPSLPVIPSHPSPPSIPTHPSPPSIPSHPTHPLPPSIPTHPTPPAIPTHSSPPSPPSHTGSTPPTHPTPKVVVTTPTKPTARVVTTHVTPPPAGGPQTPTKPTTHTTPPIPYNHGKIPLPFADVPTQCVPDVVLFTNKISDKYADPFPVSFEQCTCTCPNVKRVPTVYLQEINRGGV